MTCLKPTAVLVAIVSLTWNCNRPAATSNNAAAASFLDLAGMDKSVQPGDDFDAYANGAWRKNNPIPADKASYGVFAIVEDRTREQVRAIIQEAAGAPTGVSDDVQKIGNFYTSFMDEPAIEAKGIEPLKPRLDTIARISTRQHLARAIGSTLRADVDPLNNTNFQTGNLFGVWIAQGLTDPSRHYPYLLQGGLDMPDRDYYISRSPKMAALRSQYRVHIETMLKLAGIARPELRAQRVFALETKIAKIHATRVESAEVQNAAAWKRTELTAKAPGLDWSALLTAARLNDAPTFIVWHPKAVAGISALAASEPIDAWKDWLTFHAIEEAAPFLTKTFVDERFHFHGKALSGIPEQRPRWQRAVDITSAALTGSIGKVYVRRLFPPQAKAQVQALVDGLLKAFGQRIDQLAWMSPETKAKARRKLETLKVGVGYPDRWIDDSALSIAKGDPLGNAERAGLFYYQQQLAKLRQSPDRGEWWMSPQTVNAVNLPLQNALNFPAGYLQPPYFIPEADAAYNYGSLGATIGHEISHSFDDQGAQFDADGRLANWWTPADFEHFKSAGEALVAQYNAYRPFPDLAVNGRQPLSENIADLAGLLAAYDAYQLSLNGNPDVTKDGLTGDQRFFLSYAQSWRSNEREADLRRQIITDGHAPDRYRLATVRNLDPWYPAFNVTPAQKLFLSPENRVKVW
ncbi:MAG: M13 family metallopeptidase [Bryobacterales bacterium]|nr:M13 family metallopeptidase [Bryobacterales bacterium]